MSAHPSGFVVWFTGLPCSGKTTLATRLGEEIGERGLKTHLLDGDSLRKAIASDLGFSKEDRDTHVRRAALLASSMLKPSTTVIVSLISPYRSAREYARRQIGSFVEVYLRCPLAVCEARDVKGLYRLARAGKVPHFTGLTDPYEEPQDPELTVDTDLLGKEQSVKRITDYLEMKGFID